MRLLLGAGADPGTRTNGITPLENAIGAGNTRTVYLPAEHGIVPAVLSTYAACGRLDLVQACFDADGRLRPDAALPRPNPADFFPFGRTGLLWAILHQQVEVVRLLMERGADPSLQDEFVPFGAAGLLGIMSAVDRRDPVIRQLRKLIKSRSR